MIKNLIPHSTTPGSGLRLINHSKVAGVNSDVMLYAASLPKIAVLLGAFVKIESGEMLLNDQTRAELTRMIRKSSSEAATAVLKRIGIENLAEILQSEEYRLYDPKHNGGLWAGRDYSEGPVWKQYPLHNIFHGSTAMQTARFYYLAVTGRLVSKQYLDDFAEIMQRCHRRQRRWISIHHRGFGGASKGCRWISPFCSGG